MFERSHTTVPVTAADQLAGFLVRDAARFRFVAADRRFGILDGSRFSRLPDAQRAVDRVANLARDEAGPRHRHDA
jgi:hypothetical protein